MCDCATFFGSTGVAIATTRTSTPELANANSGAAVDSILHAFSRRRWSALAFARFTVGEVAGPFGSLRHWWGCQMAFRFSTNLSASAWASRSRRTRSAAFRGGVVFQAGTPPKKECMSLFIRQEGQHSEDRLLANAWSKDYICSEREGSKPSIGQTRERSPIKRLRK
jgi:hypothetical protein